MQLVIFLLSESSKKNCNDFVSFLLGNILDNSGKENAYLIFTQSNFYLISYVARSKILSTRAAVRITLLLIEQLQEKLTRMTPK